ncbi:MAG: F0F1 ATP synthase subunit gamma, partial [Actinobacteria bacterium]
MPRLADVRQRMRAVAGIGEVCRTLATVASAKLSQTRERAANARVYAAVLRRMVARQQRATRAAGVDPATLSPLLATRPETRRVLLIAVGADRGLCGGYNLAEGRYLRARLGEWRAAGVEVTVVVRGTRLDRYLRRTG